MLEHDEAGSAVTLPPPDADPDVVPLLSSSLPPQPAAATASAANRPTSATALRPLFTLPPPWASGSASNTTTEYPRWDGQTQARRSRATGAFESVVPPRAPSFSAASQRLLSSAR